MKLIFVTNKWVGKKKIKNKMEIKQNNKKWVYNKN
jgi:hypothetical protein